METAKEKMTVSEALDQGYTHCVKDNGERFQGMTSITDLLPEDFEGNDYVLVCRDSESPSICEDEIRDLLADHIYCQWYDQTGDDTEEVNDAIKKIDFSSIVRTINDSLSNVNYYESNGINLIPDPIIELKTSPTP